jgi:hypothetical protein
METIWTKKIRLGKIDGEVFYLLPPKFEYNSYWSFGYLESKTTFRTLNRVHYNSSESIHNFLMNIPDLNPKIKQNIWLFLDLFFTAYQLKAAAEIIRRGSAHYSARPLLVDLVRNTDEADRINNIVLPELFNTIYNLIK